MNGQDLIGTEPSRIAVGTLGPVAIANHGSFTVWIGDDQVTPQTGWPLMPGEHEIFANDGSLCGCILPTAGATPSLEVIQSRISWRGL